jgi:hypothetical protein
MKRQEYIWDSRQRNISSSFTCLEKIALMVTLVTKAIREKTQPHGASER